MNSEGERRKAKRLVTLIYFKSYIYKSWLAFYSEKKATVKLNRRKEGEKVVLTRILTAKVKCRILS